MMANATTEWAQITPLVLKPFLPTATRPLFLSTLACVSLASLV